MKVDAQVLVDSKLKDEFKLASRELTIIVDLDYVTNESDIIYWVAYELGEKFHCAIYPDQFEIVNLDEILLAI